MVRPPSPTPEEIASVQIGSFLDSQLGGGRRHKRSVFENDIPTAPNKYLPHSYWGKTMPLFDTFEFRRAQRWNAAEKPRRKKMSEDVRRRKEEKALERELEAKRAEEKAATEPKMTKEEALKQFQERVDEYIRSKEGKKVAGQRQEQASVLAPSRPKAVDSLHDLPEKVRRKAALAKQKEEAKRQVDGYSEEEWRKKLRRIEKNVRRDYESELRQQRDGAVGDPAKVGSRTQMRMVNGKRKRSELASSEAEQLGVKSKKHRTQGGIMDSMTLVETQPLHPSHHVSEESTTTQPKRVKTSWDWDDPIDLTTPDGQALLQATSTPSRAAPSQDPESVASQSPGRAVEITGGSGTPGSAISQHLPRTTQQENEMEVTDADPHVPDQIMGNSPPNPNAPNVPPVAL